MKLKGGYIGTLCRHDLEFDLCWMQIVGELEYQHIQEQLETPELNPSKDNNDFLLRLKCSREAPAVLMCCFQKRCITAIWGWLIIIFNISNLFPFSLKLLFFQIFLNFLPEVCLFFQIPKLVRHISLWSFWCKEALRFCILKVSVPVDRCCHAHYPKPVGQWQTLKSQCMCYNYCPMPLSLCILTLAWCCWVLFVYGTV